MIKVQYSEKSYDQKAAIFYKSLIINYDVFRISFGYSIPKHKYFIALNVYETYGGFFEARVVLVGDVGGHYPYCSSV